MDKCYARGFNRVPAGNPRGNAPPGTRPATRKRVPANPLYSLTISFVSCPGNGGGRRMVAGVLENFTGGRIARQPPSLGCSRTSKKSDRLQMRVVQHLVQPVGAHDRDAVLFAELHPFLDGVRHRGLALHRVVDADAAALGRREEALALIGVRDAAELHELRRCRAAHRLDADMSVLAFERTAVGGERGRVAHMADRAARRSRRRDARAG